MLVPVSIEPSPSSLQYEVILGAVSHTETWRFSCLCSRPTDRARLRLAAAYGLLKIAGESYYRELIALPTFQELALVMQVRFLETRSFDRNRGEFMVRPVAFIVSFLGVWVGNNQELSSALGCRSRDVTFCVSSSFQTRTFPNQAVVSKCTVEFVLRSSFKNLFVFLGQWTTENRFKTRFWLVASIGGSHIVSCFSQFPPGLVLWSSRQVHQETPQGTGSEHAPLELLRYFRSCRNGAEQRKEVPGTAQSRACWSCHATGQGWALRPLRLHVRPTQQL